MQRCTRSRFFVESQACVEQTYFPTLTAHTEASHEVVIQYTIVVTTSKISLLQSSISCPYSMLDTIHKRKTMVITL